MKKRFLIALLLVCSLFLVACGKDDEEDSDKSSDSKEKVVEKSTGSRKAAEKFLDGYVTFDGTKVCKAILPIMVEDEFDSLEECAEDFEDFMSDTKDASYEITGSEKLDSSDLKNLLEDLADEYGVKEKDVTEAENFTVKLTLEGKEVSQTLTVIKYKGTWYAVM